MRTDRDTTVDLLNELADTCITQGDLTEAKKHLRRAAELQACEANDVSEAGRAKTIALDGLVRLRSGDGSGANRQFGQAISILDAAYGPTFPQIADALTYMGEYLQDVAHDLNGARLRYLKALVLFEEAYGLKHASIVRTLERIGSIRAEEKRAFRAEWWFDYAVAISAARNDRDNTVVAIPRLIRLRRTGYTWTTMQSFEREHEERLSRIYALYGHESEQSREARRYHESLEDFVAAGRRKNRLNRFVSILVPILLPLVPVAFFWARSRNPRVEFLTPYVIAGFIVFTSMYAVSRWLIWRARKGRPLLFASNEEGELKEYDDLKEGGFHFHALVAFWHYRHKGDSFAKLAEADTRLILKEHRRSLKLIEQLLKSSPGQAPILRRRALALLDQAEHSGHDLARSAASALSDLDQAACAEPSSFGELLRARALRLLERVDALPGATAQPGADDQDSK